MLTTINLIITVCIIVYILCPYNKNCHCAKCRKPSYDRNKVRRYKLVENFRDIKEGDYLLKKDGKTYYWRPTWEDAYVNE